MILENNKNFDILFIQELSWLVIHQLPSSLSEEEEDLIGVLHHLSWIIFTRLSLINNNHPRVFNYINNKLVKLWFSLRKDIFNHWNINLISFFNCGTMFFILNIYLDDQQNTLKYLKNTEVNLNNVVIITRNFNIRNNDWDPSYPYHLTHTPWTCWQF